MNLLFFVVGPAPILHMQAMYAMRAAYAHARPDDRLHILTDAPALYANLPIVTVSPLTAEEISRWKGDQGYFFRVKINAIRKFVAEHPDEDVMFMDSDTYCIQDFSRIPTLLSQGYGVMHLDEGSMERMKGESGDMWQQTCGKTFAGITIGPQHHMWNSGIVAIPAANAATVMDKALELCDAFLAAGVTCFNLEQWAVAIALQEEVPQHAIQEAYRLFGHYWHHKYVWCEYITRFFSYSYSYGRTLEQELDAIRRTNHRALARKLAIKRTFLKLLH